MNTAEFIEAWRAWDAAPRDKRRADAFGDACNVLAKQIGVDSSKLRDLLSALRRYGLDYDRCLRTIQFVGTLANR